MSTVTNTIPIVYNINGLIARTVNVRYGINLRVRQDNTLRYDIIEYDRVSQSVSLLYNIVDKAVIQHESTCSVKVGGVAIAAETVTIEAEEGSYCISCEVVLLKKNDWLLCTVGSTLSITINGMEYGFVIDSPGRGRKFNKTGYTVRARSKTSELDFPTAEAVSFTNASTTANTLCASLCSACGIALDWRILDWSLLAGVVVAEGDAPLNIVRKIAAAAGAVLQSTIDGETLIVQYKHQGGTATRIFTDELNILRWVETQYKGSGFNSVRISDRSIVSEDDSAYIYIELDDVRNGGQSSFNITDTIYLRVYSSEPYTMQVTSGTITRIAVDEVRLANGDIILFDGEVYPSVSKPIDSVGDVIWYGNDLGAVSKVVASEVSAELAGPETLGIAKTAYNVKHDVWRLVPPPEVTGEYHIYVKSSQTGG